MDLVAFVSGSSVPNGFALLCAIVVAVVAFCKRQWPTGVILLALVVVLAAAIWVKNLEYGWLVADTQGENDPAAHYAFASALTWVWIVEVLVGLGLGVFALTIKDRLMRTLAGLGMIASFYAALCMSDWSTAYEHENPLSPVRYVAGMPLLHWAALVAIAAMIVVLVAPVVANFVRPRRRQL